MLKKRVGRFAQRHLLIGGVATLFLLIGFVVGLTTHITFDFIKFQFDEKINLVDLLSVVNTIVLALIVSAVLDRKRQSENSSKNVLLKRVEELYQFISDTSIKSTSGEFLLINAASATKRINVTVGSIYGYLKGNDISIDNEIQNKITDSAKKLNVLLTYTPVNDSAQSQHAPVKVESGVLSFSRERELEIENEFESLKNFVMSLQLAIINS